MIHIRFHKNFEKKYLKLLMKEKSKVKERISIFSENPFDLLLRNHPLLGKYQEYRSINITADIRALYRLVSKNEVFFVFVGTHSELYF